MMKPTDEQLRDPKWWDENAPEGASWAALDEKGRFRCWQRYEIGNEPEFKITLVKRPTKPAAPEWDGEEFPVPIGVSCECTFAVEHHDTWHKGKVVFHGIDPEGREYIVVDTGVYQACFRSVDYIRPLRTKEQNQREELKAIVAWKDYDVEDTVDLILKRFELKERDND